MKRDPFDGPGAGGDAPAHSPPPGPGGGPQGGGAQGAGARKYDSGPIDVVALARGLDPGNEPTPPPPVLKASQLGQVLKPKPPPMPLWVRILLASAALAVCGVVGMRFYRSYQERKAAEAAAFAAAEAKAAKEAKERAAAVKAAKDAREAKEAAERAEAEKKAAAARAAALAAAEQAAATDPGASKGHHRSSRSSRSSSSSAAAEPAPASNEPLPANLTRDDILKGMQGIQPQVSSCFAQYHVPGTALVSMTISGSGRVSKANIVGPLAGTPTGDCVGKAVRGASFSRFSGKAMSVQYPIVLR